MRSLHETQLRMYLVYSCYFSSILSGSMTQFFLSQLTGTGRLLLQQQSHHYTITIAELLPNLWNGAFPSPPLLPARKPSLPLCLPFCKLRQKQPKHKQQTPPHTPSRQSRNSTFETNTPHTSGRVGFIPIQFLQLDQLHSILFWS